MPSRRTSRGPSNGGMFTSRSHLRNIRMPTVDYEVHGWEKGDSHKLTIFVNYWLGVDRLTEYKGSKKAGRL